MPSWNLVNEEQDQQHKFPYQLLQTWTSPGRDICETPFIKMGHGTIRSLRKCAIPMPSVSKARERNEVGGGQLLHEPKSYGKSSCNDFVQSYMLVKLLQLPQPPFCAHTDA
jgi:hypothetical protein